MAPIVTLTMNPTLDKSTSTHHVVPEDKLRCGPLRVEPGGGGINVSRAIRKLNGSSHLLYLSGGLTGQALGHLLREEELQEQPIPIEEPTRESFTVLDEASTNQYRFTMPGPEVSQREWERCLQTIEALDPRPDYLVASGSLPPGVPADFYLRVASLIADWSTRLIVDTSGPSLKATLREKSEVYLIKPNLRELTNLVGRELNDDAQIRQAARQLVDDGCSQAVVLSLGAAGVLLVTESFTQRIPSPTVPIRSKIGAGDSTVAGITLQLAQGADLQDAVYYGVAAGAAAVMTSGTELCRKEDADRLYTMMQEEKSRQLDKA